MKYAVEIGLGVMRYIQFHNDWSRHLSDDRGGFIDIQAGCRQHKHTVRRETKIKQLFRILSSVVSEGNGEMKNELVVLFHFHFSFPSFVRLMSLFKR
jgi:hypothetical protein